MLNRKQIESLIEYYRYYGLDDSINFKDSYFLDNYMTLVECKNFDINPYDAERIIELRKLFNIGLNISDALGIIETLENNYSIDSFDLHDILNRK